LSAERIRAVVDFLYAEGQALPQWGMDEMRRSHKVFSAAGPEKPMYQADPLNLFLVVEAGDHHVTVLDGDRLEPIRRFPTHYALHGGPKFSADGRFVYLASRDGWVSKYDLWGLAYVAEVRAGINTRNLAVSRDGRYVLVGNSLPHSLVLLDGRDLSPLRVIPVRGADGRESRVSAVYEAPPRHSFIVALKDVPEVWELSDRSADPAIRRIPLSDVLDDFFFDPGYRHLIGAARSAKGGQVVDLESGQVTARVDLPGLPHLGSGITWSYHGHRVLATPNLKEAAVTVIDLADWKVVKRIPTLGPGFFLRSHENTPYAWVDVFSGPNKDAVQVIDKATLQIVKTLRPAPGKTSGHVEFSRDGRYALVSVWEMDGAVVVYDAKTLEEVKRLPMKKPVGKYNVYNKISLSDGTSH
jgi:DNA-binding beta-propeller fold protein YncE